MNNNGPQNQAISDDQELASVLKGMQQQNHSLATSDPEAHDKDGVLNFEEVPNPAAPAAAVIAPPAIAIPSTPVAPVAPPTEPAAHVAAEPNQIRGGGELDTIKKEALEELRPLVDKLNLPPKEKFDTMLLIIRSTDDKSLLNPAHIAAKAIPDDVERAQALLDVIKEIDYFASQTA